MQDDSKLRDPIPYLKLSFSPENKHSNKKFLSNQLTISMNQGSLGSSSSLKKSSSQQSQFHAFSNFNSSSTLQHSTALWGFSKAQRFPKPRNLSVMTSLLELPSTLSKSTTTMGFGSKIVMSDLHSKETKNFPAPNHYPAKSDFPPDINKGKSFGLPYVVYEKNYIPNLNYQSAHVAKDFPGPGQYNVEEQIGSKKKKITLKSRIKWFTDENRTDAPPSNYYNPVQNLTEPSRFKKISLGYGTRSAIGKLNDFVPGPGTYRLPSVFDRFAGTKSTRESKTVRIRHDYGNDSEI